MWARIGCLSFGGPAGQIALMYRELVEERRWISEARFLHALNYCMLLPGPEAQQLATYVGWLLHRWPGGLIAGSLFVVPGFLVVLALSAVYAVYGRLAPVEAAFDGLKAAVVVIVVEALVRIGRRALSGRVSMAVATIAFLALYVFHISFPLVILAAGLFGWSVGATVFPSGAPGARTNATDGDCVIDALAARGALGHAEPRRGRSIRVLALGLLAWWLPVAALGAAFGRDSVFFDQAFFFSRAAVVTFGGAYSVLAYVAQQAVSTYAWLAPGEMLDGLGLAETTPGPLILVLEFVGFLGAFRHPGALGPVVAGVLGAVVTVWVTFVPCFLWIFLGGPHIEALRGNRRVQAALSSITAAVVGVVANLSVWFAVHSMFGEVSTELLAPLRVALPVWTSVDLFALSTTAFAALAIFRWRLGIPPTLAICAAIGLARTALAA